MDIEQTSSEASVFGVIGRCVGPTLGFVGALALVALSAGCDDGGEPAAESESARVAKSDKPAEADPDEASCANSDEPVKFACSDAEGSFRCCLTGCLPPGTDGAAAIATDAISLVDSEAQVVRHESKPDGQCISLAAQPSDGEAAAPTLVAARLDLANVPSVADKKAELDGVSVRFASRAWWCSSAHKADCEKLLTGADSVKIIALHGHELMRGEAKTLGQCDTLLAGKGKRKRPVVVEHVAQKWRVDALATWLDAYDFEQRSERAKAIDEAVLSRGVTMVVRWNAPKVRKNRKPKDRLKSRGTDAMGVLVAAPGEPVREYAWLRADLGCNEEYREHQLWMARVVDDVFSELNKQSKEAP